MSDLIPFDYDGRQVRTIQIDSEPWFVASDVCSVLGTDTSNLSKILDQDERGTSTVRTPAATSAFPSCLKPACTR